MAGPKESIEDPGNPEEDAKLVLRVVAERDMDGYLLSKMTGLKGAPLENAVRLLSSRGLLKVKGEIAGPRMLESWFQAAPDAVRRLQFL